MKNFPHLRRSNHDDESETKRKDQTRAEGNNGTVKKKWERNKTRSGYWDREIRDYLKKVFP